MDDTPPLFDVDPSPRLAKGDRVLVQTMWGEERAMVLRVIYEDNFPLVQVETPSGDRISISVARVTRIRDA